MRTLLVMMFELLHEYLWREQGNLFNEIGIHFNKASQLGATLTEIDCTAGVSSEEVTGDGFGKALPEVLEEAGVAHGGE